MYGPIVGEGVSAEAFSPKSLRGREGKRPFTCINESHYENWIESMVAFFCSPSIYNRAAEQSTTFEGIGFVCAAKAPGWVVPVPCCGFVLLQSKSHILWPEETTVQNQACNRKRSLFWLCVYWSLCLLACVYARVCMDVCMCYAVFEQDEAGDER